MDRHSIREDATSVDTASYGVGDMEFWHGKRSQGIIKINLLMPNTSLREAAPTATLSTRMPNALFSRQVY
ncbi:MAG: hypothetical protein RMY62_012805 [Nostoc sp. ZfuVER08]|nr:hypothetical protein [Nostoc sp. ZfuVER08]